MRSLVPLYISIAGITTAVFIGDLLTPLGVAIWILYVVPLGMTLFDRNPMQPINVALADYRAHGDHGLHRPARDDGLGGVCESRLRRRCGLDCGCARTRTDIDASRAGKRGMGAARTDVAARAPAGRAQRQRARGARAEYPARRGQCTCRRDVFGGGRGLPACGIPGRRARQRAAGDISPGRRPRRIGGAGETSYGAEGPSGRLFRFEIRIRHGLAATRGHLSGRHRQHHSRRPRVRVRPSARGPRPRSSRA